jgi:GDPmannose 4,6-dehydratase
MKTAIITGISGQDGPYLARHLLQNDYKVIGWARRNASLHGLEYLGIKDHVTLVDIDIGDPFQVSDEIYKAKPQEIYNLAAQSHVGQSFKNPMVTCQVNYGGYLNILHAARKFFPDCKIYQAGTSEMFGYSADTICDERTPFAPMSPYAIAKVASHWAGVNARYEAKQFVCNGILFNHESPLRGRDFVTKKVTDFVKAGAKGILKFGNLDSQRDWGHAKDYVEAMHLMMQQSAPDDFVIASGVSTSIRNMVKLAFEAGGMEIKFDGEGRKEVGLVNGKVKLVVEEEFYRPNDLKFLRGNFNKARQMLGWKPTTTFEQLIYEMVKA